MSKPSDNPSQQYAEDPTVFDEVVVGIFRSSHEGKYIYANRRLAELYGYDSPATLIEAIGDIEGQLYVCLLYTSPSPRDVEESRMPSSA